MKITAINSSNNSYSNIKIPNLAFGMDLKDLSRVVDKAIKDGRIPNSENVLKRIDSLTKTNDRLKVFAYEERCERDINYPVSNFGVTVILPPNYRPKSSDYYLPVALTNGEFLKVFGKSIGDKINSALDYLEKVSKAVVNKNNKAA